MMKILKSKGWTLAAIGVALVMLISGILAALRFYVPSILYDTPVNLLEGKYSVDGGEWITGILPSALYAFSGALI